jgi:hypothetical protein
VANSTQAPKSNLIKLLIGGAVVMIIAFKATESQPVVRKKSSGRPDATLTTKKKGKEDFLPEDYSAEFASLSERTKNSFKPLIASKNANSVLQPISPNAIPPLFAGGDPNWIYTGNMEVDGVPNALLENRQTGEGVFLRPRERWRKMVLREVGKDFIVLDGPNGYVKTVTILDESATQTVAPAQVVVGTVGGTLPPAGPTPNGRQAFGNDGRNITGQIGNGPNGGTQANIDEFTNDGSFDPNNQQRGRRTRRNR